jgi:hypothetical protein
MPSTALYLARRGGINLGVLVVLLWSVSVSAAAQAATKTAPDPAPATAGAAEPSSSAASTPAPDPTPGSTSGRSSTGTQPTAPTSGETAIPGPTGATAITSGPAEPSATVAPRPTLIPRSAVLGTAAPGAGRFSARTAVNTRPQVHGRSRSIGQASQSASILQLVLPGARDLFGVTGTTVPALARRPSGLLLLLGALALGALVLASSSMLRLLMRMNAEWPERQP